MLKDLLKPEKFKGDQYGWLTNQIGHIFVGFIALNLAAFGTLSVGEVFSPQWLIAVTITAIYLVLWEWLTQGWKGQDSIADTLFFGIGAISASQVLDYDVSVSHGWLVADVAALVSVVLIILLVLGAYILAKARGG